ncbi:MAG: hypothetical protein M1586_00315 [Patescibacteria group bacterium]|nr:hypothetical protein [Patescibacteria group bacterium]MCL5261733.1 hypothetical protein [Patescibacteria group bacterium]
MREIPQSIEELVEAAFAKAELDDRSRKIVEKRFGLVSDEPATLQELGDAYGVTRERIRQVESQAVADIKEAVAKIAETDALIGFVIDHLAGTGGVRRDNLLMDDLYNLSRTESGEEVFKNKLRFLLQLKDAPRFYKEDDNYYDFWYLQDDTLNVLDSIHSSLLKQLKKTEEFLDILRSIVAPQNMTETVALHYVSISKKIDVGPYGDLGLRDWDEIRPKTVRAKIYLALKKSGKPLHFTEIAAMIKSHAPTVHNELIKDRDKFTLVSRGTYGLKQWS